MFSFFLSFLHAEMVLVIENVPQRQLFHKEDKGPVDTNIMAIMV